MSFEKIIEFVLQWEGGYSYDKKDPGGETQWGISARSYPDLDISKITIEQAKELYRKDYWNKVAKGTYDDLDMCAMDCAVNCGVGRTQRWLTTCKTWHELLAKREEHYRNISVKNPALKKYLKGWLNRTEALRQFLV